MNKKSMHNMLINLIINKLIYNNFINRALN